MGKVRTNEGSADPEQNPHKNNKKQNKTIREVIPENPVEEETGNGDSESEKSRTPEKSENPVNQQEIENQMKKNRNKSVSPMKTRRLSKGSQLFSLNLRTQKKISKKAKHQKPIESNEEKSETLSDIENGYALNKFVLNNDLRPDDMLQKVGLIVAADFVSDYVDDYLSGRPLEFLK